MEKQRSERVRLSAAELREIVDDPNRYVQDTVAELVTGIPRMTLRKWRHAGRGPRYVKTGTGDAGSVRYKVAWLLEFLEDRVVETSDSKRREATA